MTESGLKLLLKKTAIAFEGTSGNFRSVSLQKKDPVGFWATFCHKKTYALKTAEGRLDA
ncbi:MAG: hypothetical protein CM1200mP30_22920 [Pseudomonadota bacterium]|nr:MAG: hypothetical protein CM1200mP30_22920 [Pseudomonadota bacterium]